MRRFPPPWTVEALDGGGFKVIDANGQSLAYVYSRENENERRSFPPEILAAYRPKAEPAASEKQGGSLELHHPHYG
jgi:hypothetical protein